MSTLIQGNELRTLTQGVLVEIPTASLPASGTPDALVDVVGGRVLLIGVVGEVTTVIETVANATKLYFDPTATGANQDLCATLDITADPVGELYTISGTVTDAMRSDLLIGNPILTNPLVLSEGTVYLNCAANAATGSVQWSFIYVPLDNGAYMQASTS